MPIRINLMAEAQAAEEARRRDPVKLGIWIAGFFVAVVGLWIAKKQLDIHFAKDQLDHLNQQWNVQKPQFDNVTNYQARDEDVKSKLAALDRLSTNRFLWGSLLNALQFTMVDNVSVTGIKGEQTYTVQEPKFLGTGSTKTMINGGVIESIKLTINGRDFDPINSGYSKYKDALCNYPYFVQHLGRNDGFVVEGTLGTLTVDPQDPSKQFQNFTLATHFPDVMRQ